MACKDRLDELTVADWRRLLNLPCGNAMRGNQRSPWYDGKCAAAKAADWRRSSTFRRLADVCVAMTSREQDWAPSQGRCSTSCASCRPPPNMAAPTPMSDFNKSSAKIAQLIENICHGKKDELQVHGESQGKK